LDGWGLNSQPEILIIIQVPLPSQLWQNPFLLSRLNKFLIFSKTFDYVSNPVKIKRKFSVFLKKNISFVMDLEINLACQKLD